MSYDSVRGANSVTNLPIFGSAGGLFLLIWWRARKRSQLGRRAGPQDMHKLFDKDFGDSL